MKNHYTPPQPFDGREGAMDAFRLPSRHGDVLWHRNEKSPARTREEKIENIRVNPYSKNSILITQ